MNDLIENQVKAVWWSSIAALFLTISTVVLRDIEGELILLSVAGSNVAWCYWGVIRYGRQTTRTIWWHYTFLSHSAISIFVAVAIPVAIVCSHKIGFHSEYARAFFAGVAIVSVHQAWRGWRIVHKKWQSADDVRLTMLNAKKQNFQGLGRQYDFAFFLGISLISSVIAHFWGQEIIIVVIVVVYALIAPFVVSCIWTCKKKVGQLFPHDEPLAELFSEGRQTHSNRW